MERCHHQSGDYLVLHLVHRRSDVNIGRGNIGPGSIGNIGLRNIGLGNIGLQPV